MTEIARKLLDEAMALSADERELIAMQLFDSLEDGDEDPIVVEKAWAEEVDRRIRQIDSGEVVCRPFDEVMQDLRARLRG